jgi:hypothetical protein
MLIFPAKDMATLSTPGLTKDLNEAVFFTVTTLAFGYYRIYVDGPINQRLFLVLGGVSKLGSACLLVSWVVQGHATKLLLALGVLPEICFGAYFLRTWWGLPPKQLASSNGSSSRNKKSLAFGIAAAHLVLLALPSLALSLAERTADMDVGVASVLSADGLALVSARGLTRDIFRMFYWLLLCFSVGYYRVFVDGVSAQPLMAFVGAVAKLGAASLITLGYLQGNTTLGVVCVGTIPDLVLIMYFVKAWIAAGATFAPPRSKEA